MSALSFLSTVIENSRVQLEFWYFSEDSNEIYRFRPSRVRRLRRRTSLEDGPTMSMSFEDSTDEEIRESGIGILEFSPAKAGQDVTQANYNFPPKERKRSSSGFTSLPGNGMLSLLLK